MNSNETHIIQELLDTTKGKLELIAQDYFAHFKDTTSIFEAASLLSEKLIDKVGNTLKTESKLSSTIHRDLLTPDQL